MFMRLTLGSRRLNVSFYPFGKSFCTPGDLSSASPIEPRSFFFSDADAVVDNFADCPLRAAMCCFTADRQANDNNGNCAKPYDTNCINSDPADNTE